MKERNLRFFMEFPNIKAWKFFSSFFLLPTIYVSNLNTYSAGEKYLYTRYIQVSFLWFSIGVQWDYGEKTRT